VSKGLQLGVSHNARNSTRHGSTIFSRTLSHGVSWMDLGSHRVILLARYAVGLRGCTCFGGSSSCGRSRCFLY